jgi:hypothetical protein
LVSTTVIAPLIARWNDLRATKRDLRRREEVEAQVLGPPSGAQARLQELRDNAQSRLEGFRTLIVRNRDGLPSNHVNETALEQLSAALAKDEQTKRPTRSDSVRIGLWLAGVGVGLLAAGAGAYFIARRRLAASAEEPLLELPPVPSGGNGARPDAREASRGGQPRERQKPPASRSGMAGRMAPAGANEGEASQPSQHGGRATPPPPGAKFVGNIHTMIYHAADDLDHLPAEDNRVYFASEEEAVESDYHRDRHEVPPPQASVRSEEPTI